MYSECVCESDEDADSSSFLDDVLFIKHKYTDMFASLDILSSTESSVTFKLTTLNNKSGTVRLSASTAYVVLDGEAQGQCFEAFEPLLLRLMGPVAFSTLINELLSNKLA